MNKYFQLSGELNNFGRILGGIMNLGVGFQNSNSWNLQSFPKEKTPPLIRNENDNASPLYSWRNFEHVIRKSYTVILEYYLHF